MKLTANLNLKKPDYIDSVDIQDINDNMDTIDSAIQSKANSSQVLTDVPANAKFTDTTYTEITTAEIDVGTASTLRTITARRVKYIIDKIVAMFPSKTSDLTNDSGFITSSAIPTSLPANGGNADTVGGFTVGVNVPANAKFTDTVYTHPVNHPPSIITQDASNRFVTDTEKATWNGKSNFSGSYNDLSNKPTIPDTSTLLPKSGGVLENYSEKKVRLSGTNVSIDLSLGNVFVHLITGNTNYTIINAPYNVANSLTLIIENLSGDVTITFPDSIFWANGEIPDLTLNGGHLLTLFTYAKDPSESYWLSMYGGVF